MFMICSAQPSVNGMESEGSKLNSNQPAEKSKSDDSSLFTDKQDFFGKSDYNPVGGEFSIRAIIAILFVLILFVIAIYFSRKFLPKIANLPGKEIRVLETIHLGPRKAVHLLEINKQRFLIGSTNESVTKLADLGRDLTNLSSDKPNFN